MKLRRKLFRKQNLSLVLIFLLCLPAIAFSQSIRHKNRNFTTSIYYAPLALLHFNVGPSFRGGLEQGLGRHFSVFAEASKSIVRSPSYKDLQGHKIEAGIKYTLNQDEFHKEWLSISLGKLDHSFSQKGKFYRTDTIIDAGIKKLRRRAEFLHLGIGATMYGKRGFYFETGFQLGIRHRDLDIEGMEESQEEEFRVDNLSDSESAAMQSNDMWLPDLSFNIRFGYWFQASKQK